MATSILVPSFARYSSIVLAASASVFALACSGSAAPSSDGQQDTTGAGGAGGSDMASMGGNSTTVGAGGTSATGGATGTGGTTSMTGTTGGMGGTIGVAGAMNAGGSGPTGGPPIMYTTIGDNNATWAGGSTPDTVVVNAKDYLPLAASDCPKDPDMAIVAPYKDKIFNGCIDECFGDPDMTGHGKSTVFDWNVATGGWAVAQLSSTLHWTGMWAPTTGPQPTMVVFWIKGASGGEQTKFTVAIHSHLSNTLSTALKVPITVTQAWQRVVMPWSSFNVPASPYPDALAFSATGTGKVTFFIDQAYLSKTVAAP